MQDASNIGSTAAIQDPQDAIDAKHGKYQGNADNLTDAQKYPQESLPSAPDPQPYTLTGGGGGSR
jgi:hypothetical protein